jgi:putative nucleotidyltransferase with HDIG domain
LEQSDSILLNALGKRSIRNVYSSSGVLLVPASEVITREHMQILAKHGIVLTDRDVADVGPYAAAESYRHQRMIDEAVMQVGQIFEEIRETQKIPLAELRNGILPIVHEACNGPDLFGLFAALQSKDDYTYRHNIAVGAIASLIGTWMGLDRQELLQLTTAALLHDVGKMFIPLDILNKPTRLTAEEYAQMKNHTVLGYEVLKETVGISHRQALVALQHHERMDGSGYPFGLGQDRIEKFSRIVAVADVFHAMTSTRVYRTPSPFYKVLFQMEKDAFGALDPVITRLFIGKIMNDLIGRSVMLTDGSEGKILMVQPGDPTHPLIQVGSGFVDLSKDFSVHIQQIL